MRKLGLTLSILAGLCATSAVAGTWQTPGAIQQPKGPWQTPGAIQVPKGIQAVHATTTGCERRLSVLADALFAFNQSSLSPDAAQTLQAALQTLKATPGRPERVEGHTDAIGSDAYNMTLSEARARAVRDWLSAHGAIPAATPIEGYGKRDPIAPNTRPDGSDNPEGRQQNRRVDILFSTCKA
jgi:outer membrane protein OmpA-like peptidoglycan-associated protein